MRVSSSITLGILFPFPIGSAICLGTTYGERSNIESILSAMQRCFENNAKGIKLDIDFTSTFCKSTVLQKEPHLQKFGWFVQPASLRITAVSQEIIRANRYAMTLRKICTYSMSGNSRAIPVDPLYNIELNKKNIYFFIFIRSIFAFLHFHIPP